MDKSCELEILPPAQAELEEIARVHMVDPFPAVWAARPG